MADFSDPGLSPMPLLVHLNGIKDDLAKKSSVTPFHHYNTDLCILQGI